MSGLPPGEQVLKDTGMFPVTWTKSTFSNVNGKLILTNKRLIFTAGRFQSVVGAVVGAHKDRVEIALNTITSVDKGFMAVINIMASGQKYTFKGMRDAGGWISQINTARMTSGAAQGYAPQARSAPAPPPVAAGNKFCPSCGAAVVPGNSFCGQCGSRVA
jgi:hypothetical protein